MNIHEHQAKAVLAEFGVPVPRGFAAFTPAEAKQGAEKLGGSVFVVKSQIHAGGRGKGKFEGLGPDAKGGVRVVKSIAEVESNAAEMLGRVLVTHQTGPKGKQVNRLYIEEGAAIAKEFYLSLLVDRETSRVSVVASTEGGMDIEEVAHSTPEKIITFSIDPATGVWPNHGLRLSKALNLKGDLAKQAGKLLGQLYKAFTELDASLIEINPLVVTGAQVVCKAAVNPALTLILFNADPDSTTKTDNAAYSLAAADAFKLVAAIPLSSFYDHGTPNSWRSEGLNIVVAPTARALYGLLIDGTGVTLTSTGDIQVRLRGVGC